MHTTSHGSLWYLLIVLPFFLLVTSPQILFSQVTVEICDNGIDDDDDGLIDCADPDLAADVDCCGPWSPCLPYTHLDTLICDIRSIDGLLDTLDFPLDVTGTIPQQNQPLPLCEDGTIPNNMNWYSFVAISEEIDLFIGVEEILDASLANGIEVGLYDGCHDAGGSCLVFESNCGDPIGEVELNFSGLEIGRNYHLYVDGCQGSNISYVISVSLDEVEELDCGGDEDCEEPPTAVASAEESEICTGQDIELDEIGRSAVSWSWSGPDGFTSSIQNPVVSNAATDNLGLYTVTVTDSDGCTNTSQINIDVTVPDVEIVAVQEDVCLGEDIQLDEVGDDAQLWSWSGPDGFTSNLQNVMVLDVALAQLGNYRVTITDENGCTNWTEITISSNGLEGCTDPSANNFNINAVCDDGSCEYDCPDPGNCDDGNCANGLETWNPITCMCDAGVAVEEVDINASFTFCEGTEGTIEVVQSDITGSIVWYLDGNLIPGESNIFLRVTQPGIYAIVIDEGLDCEQSASTEVTYVSLPELTPSEYEVCNSSVQGSTIVDLTTFVVGSDLGTWRDGQGVEIADPTAYDFTGQNPGEYTFTYRTHSSEICDITLDLEVRVFDCGCPVINFPEIGPFCEGSFLFNLEAVSSNAPEGVWSTTSQEFVVNGDFLTLTNSTPPGSYELIYSLDNPEPGCPAMQSLFFIVSATEEKEISAEICEGASFELYGEFYQLAGTYQQLVTVPGCDTLITLNLNVLTAETESESYVICEGETVVIGNVPYSVAGDYSVSREGSNGCPATLNFSIEVLLRQTLTDAFVICTGEIIMVGGTPFSQAGDYSVTVMGDNGCPATLNFTIETLPSIETTEEYTICEGESVVVQGLAYDQEGTFVVETRVGDCLNTLTVIINVIKTARTESYVICEGESILINGVSYMQAGNYTVTEPVIGDCDNILNFTIEVSPVVKLEEVFTVCAGEVVVIDGLNYVLAGQYRLTYPHPSGCDTIFDFRIDHDPIPELEKNFFLQEGETVMVNGVTYTEVGHYFQTLPAQTGCDTSCIINVYEETCLIDFDFDACNSSVTLHNFDYSEFQPSYPNTLECGTVTASTFFREQPHLNTHSCTGGLDDTSAICISSETTCDFVEDSDKAGRVSIDLTPGLGKNIFISRISFAQAAPVMYQWSHSSGLNNYPTKFGLRILVDDVEVFRIDEQPTTRTWTTVDIPLGLVAKSSAAARVEVEILGYCTIGNGSSVTAFDIEDIKIYGGCSDVEQNLVIAGQVTLENMAAMENVHLVKQGGDLLHETTTSSAGGYAFTEVAPNAHYRVKAVKDENHLDGVSTLDLIIIQRHILGIESLPNSLKHIAADVNKDQSIDGVDLIELRKLILGVYESFPNNDSYRFFDAGSVQLDSDYRDLRGHLDIITTSENIYTANLTGVKIGDVNGSTVSQITGDEDVEVRNANRVTLAMENKLFTKGDLITVEALVPEAIDMVGGQMAWSYDAEFLNLAKVESPEFILNDFNLNRDTEGQLVLSWAQGNGVKLKEGTALVSLQFRAAKSGRLSEVLALDTQMAAEIYTESLGVRSLELYFESDTSSDRFSMNQNTPNPFSGFTQIDFSLPGHSNVNLTVTDMDGKVILDRSRPFAKGNQAWILSQEELSGRGGLIYRLSTDYGSATKKMIVLR